MARARENVRCKAVLSVDRVLPRPLSLRLRGSPNFRQRHNDKTELSWLTRRWSTSPLPEGTAPDRHYAM